MVWVGELGRITYVHMYIRTYIHTYIYSTHAHAHTHTHTHTHRIVALRFHSAAAAKEFENKMDLLLQTNKHPCLSPPSQPDFFAAEGFQGSRDRFVFKRGDRGLGYYSDRPPPPPPRHLVEVVKNAVHASKYVMV
jgi:hypothetical protein